MFEIDVEIKYDGPVTTAFEDDRAIRRVLAEYCHSCDDGDFDALLECFTTDAEFVFAERVVAGRDALRAWFEKTQRADRRGKHLTTNTVVDVDGDTATARSDFVFLVRSDAGLVPLLTGRYRDALVRDGSRWRLGRREAATL